MSTSTAPLTTNSASVVTSTVYTASTSADTAVAAYPSIIYTYPGITPILVPYEPPEEAETPVEIEQKTPPTTGNLFLDYTLENFEAETGKEIEDSGGSLDPFRTEILAWTIYNIISEDPTLGNTGIVLPPSHQKEMDIIRKKVFYTQFIAGTLGSLSDKAANIANAESDEEKALFATETLLSMMTVLARVQGLLIEKYGQAAVSDIRNKHKETFAHFVGIEMSQEERDILEGNSNPETVKAIHQKFLAENIERMDAAREAAEQQIKDAKDALDDKIRELNFDIIAVENDVETLQGEIEKLQKQIDDPDDDVDERLLQDDIDALNEQIAKKNTEIEDIERKKTQETVRVTSDRLELELKIDTLGNQKAALEVEQTRVDTETYSSYAKTSQALDAGVAVLSTVNSGISLAQLGISDDATPLDWATQGQFATSSALGLLATALELGNAEKFTSSIKVLNVAGSLAGVGGAAAGMAGVIQQLKEGNLSDEEARLLKAEIGLQTVAMVGEAMSGAISALASAGHLSASFAGKAVPVLGAVTAIAGAFSPATWAGFRGQEDHIENIENSGDYSADLLADLLGTNLNIQKGFHAAGAVLDASVAIGAAFASTGVGAAIALVGGAFSAIMGAVEQAAINALAREYARKMREDEDGNEQTIEEFFANSFEQQQQETRDLFEEWFDEIIESQELDAVFTLGSQTLTSTDIELAGFTSTAEEMNKTAKHYFETYLGNGEWSEQKLEVNEQVGNDQILLEDLDGGSAYLAFTTPLLASGNESTSDGGGGKNTDITHVNITDLAGWEVIDAGTNNTSFDLSKVINRVELINGTKKIDFTVRAGDGDDTYFGYDSKIIFDGGAGRDTASYAKIDPHDMQVRSLDWNDLVRKPFGISAVASEEGVFSVDKFFGKGSTEYKEAIKEREVSRGKETEIVQYRAIVVEERKKDAQVQDQLLSIEVLHGTDGADFVDGRKDTGLEEFHGFDGDDLIMAGAGTKIVTGAGGDDMFDLSLSMEALLAKAELADTDFVYADGGSGHDTVLLTSAMQDNLIEAHSNRAKLQKIAEGLSSAITAGTDDGNTLASFVHQILNGPADPYSRFMQNDVEHVQFMASAKDLTDITTLRKQDALDQLTFVNATQSIYQELSGQNLADFLAFLDGEELEGSPVFTGSLKGPLGAGELVHTTGEIFLHAGETIQFEVTASFAAIFANGEKLLELDGGALIETASFTATESGFVTLEFIAAALSAGEAFRFAFKRPDDSVFETLLATNPMSHALTYTSAGLTGLSDGDLINDKTFFASDYNAIIETTLFNDPGTTYITRNLVVDTLYEDRDLSTQLDNPSWLDVDREVGAVGELQANFTQETRTMYRGEVYLEAGVDYTFRETGSSAGYFGFENMPIIDEETGEYRQERQDLFSIGFSLSNMPTGEATITVDESGYYDYFLLVFGGFKASEVDPQPYELEIKVGPDGEFEAFDTQTMPAAELIASPSFDSYSLIGDDFSEKLQGSLGDDFIFGNDGNDMIEGGLGHNVLSGGEGTDTFYWTTTYDIGLASHNNVIELFEDDWAFNTFVVDRDLSDLRFFRDGNNAIVKVTDNTKTSITLHNYFDLDSERAQVQRFTNYEDEFYFFDGTGVSDLANTTFAFRDSYNFAEAVEMRQLASDGADSASSIADGTLTANLLDEIELKLVSELQTFDVV